MAELDIHVRCDAGSPSEVYKSLIACVLAAVKRSCHEAGLNKAASVEITSLHSWLRCTEDESNDTAEVAEDKDPKPLHRGQPTGC